MLRGSFASHSPGMQFLMLIFLALLGITVFTLIGLLLVPLLYGIPIEALLGDAQAQGDFPIEVLKFLQGISSIGLFLVPALVGAHLFSFSGPHYLKVNTFPAQWLAVLVLLVVITFSGNVISDLLYRLSKSINWPLSLSFLKETLEASEAGANRQIRSFLVMDSPFQFVQMFFIMAILPAICEEAMFRGALQPVLIKFTQSPHLGIILTAFLFAFIHLQFYTFLSIFALGVVLGYVRLWTKSLWPSVIIHLINNGSIVVAVYFYGIDYMDANDISTPWNWQMGILGLVVFIASLLGLYRLMNYKKESPIR